MTSALIGFFVLPDFPLTTKWLTEDERQLAYNRMELDTVQNKGETGTLAGLKQAARDPLVWVFAAMAHMHLAANGFKNFVGRSAPGQDLVLSTDLFRHAVPYRCRDSRPWRNCYSCSHLPTLSDRWRGYNPAVLVVWSIQRADLAYHCLKICGYSWFCCRGCYIEHGWPLCCHGYIHDWNLWSQQSDPWLVRQCLWTYVRLFPITSTHPSPPPQSGTVISFQFFSIRNCKSHQHILTPSTETKEKKSASIAIVTTVMNASFIWTPYLWPKSDEPRYAIAMGASAGFSLATFLLAWLAKFLLVRRNNKLRASNNETNTFYVY